jgi:fucose permease
MADVYPWIECLRNRSRTVRDGYLRLSPTMGGRYTRSTPMITATVALSFLSFIALGLPDGLLGVAWPTLRGDFDQPLGAIAFLLAAGSGGYLISSTSIGRIIRRIGLSRAIVSGGTAITTGLLLVSAAPSWWLLLPGYSLIGIGGGLLDAGFNAYGADHFDATRMNWMHACFGVGATVGPSVMTVSLVRTGSWRPAYLATALAIAVVTALIFRFRRGLSGDHSNDHGPVLEPVPELITPPVGHDLPALRENGRATPPLHARPTTDSRPTTDAHPTSQPAREFLRSGWFATWGGVIVFFLYTGIEVSAGQLGFTLLTEGRGVDPVRAGFQVSAFWLSLTAGRFLLGPLSKRVGNHRVVGIAFGLTAASAFLLMLNLHPAADGIALALMGFSLAPIFPLLTLLTPERVGSDRTHDVIGYQMGAATIGVVLLTGGGGALAGRFGVALIGPYIFILALLCGGLHTLVSIHKPVYGRKRT